MQIKTISAQDTMGIRHRVLWPDKPIEHCVVDEDECANHFGLFVEDVLVGVASTYEHEGVVRLRKFAVEKEHQRKGYGAAILKHVLNHAKCSGASLFWCDARENAIQFYQQFGLVVDGNRFYKSELPYFKMSVVLN